MKILFGQNPAIDIYKNLKKISQNNPKFCIIQIGDNAASNLYIKYKIDTAKKLNFDFLYKKLSNDISFNHLRELLDDLNRDNTINGIIIQLPLPVHLESIVQYISPEKDIDGLTNIQQANLYLNRDGLYPCTALGVITLLRYYNILIENKKVVILGRSNLVGKPLSLLFMHNNALTSIIHSKISKENITKELQTADIICSAIGVPHFIQPYMIKDQIVLVDIGCVANNNKILGDIHPDCYIKSSAYTPMPKGVGPMTIATLMFNIYKTYKIQNEY